MQRLNIVGGGRLGKVIGRLAAASGAYQVEAVLCRDVEHARAAAAFVGARLALTQLTELPAAELTLLAVPDGAIVAVAEALAAARSLPAGAVVFHASGALASACLAPLAAQGLQLASLHPAFSFAEPERALQTFAGTLCALEGDAGACRQLAALARAIGAEPFYLKPGGKAGYHAALTIASNYLVTLLGLAQGVAAEAGVDDATARRLLGALMTQTLGNALALGPAPALTGPIVRGDAATVAQHLAVLAPEDGALYRALGRATVTLSGDRLDQEQRSRVLAALGE